MSSTDTPSTPRPQSQFQKAQSKTGLEHCKAKMKDYRRKERGAAKAAENWTLHGSSAGYAPSSPFINILDNPATFDVSPSATPGELFLQIFDAELVTKMVHHLYCQQPEERQQVSLQEVYSFLATRLALYKARLGNPKLLVRDFWRDRAMAERPGSAAQKRQYMGYNKFSGLWNNLYLPTDLMETDLSRRFERKVSRSQCLNALGERKQPYKGHADCIRIVRQKPVLWMTQNAVLVPNSCIPYITNVIPFFRGKKERGSTSIPMLDYVRSCVQSILPDHTKSLQSFCLVFDSAYATPETIKWLVDKHILFLCSVKQQWHKKEFEAVFASLVDDGDSSQGEKVVGDEENQYDSDADPIELLGDDFEQSEPSACGRKEASIGVWGRQAKEKLT